MMTYIRWVSNECGEPSAEKEIGKFKRVGNKISEK
jgi:hypothetical protein